MLGLLGKKLGMTRLFGELGESLPITVVDVVAIVWRSKKPRQLTAIYLYKWPLVNARRRT